MATRVLCACDRRKEAQADCTLLYWAERKAWVFVDMGYRQMTPKSRYYALVDRAEYHHEDHTGEPYTFECCVFCGHELPGVPQILGQADGDSGEGRE